MQTIYSKQHRELVGSVNGAPYKVSFDADGFADVEDEVAEQLISVESFGVSLIDEDGAFVTPQSSQETVDDVVTKVTDEESKPEDVSSKKAPRASKKQSSDGGVTE